MSSDSSSSDRQARNPEVEDLKRIGKYEISRRLGAGGMGTVYLASDSDLKRTVALKVLSRDRADNPLLVRRFKSEGQAAALLKHKNIVSVYESGQADGYLFLALEYVEGIDLLEWVNRRGPIPVKRSVEIMRQSAEALQHAFERQIVHRDIKPSNLMITRNGTVKLTDMGLARSIDDTLDTTITRDGTTVGTVDYMAPEQASNSKAADIRSDIYSLGCTWYHLLTGQPPYPEGSVTNKISAHISSPLPDPRQLNPEIPEAVVAVIHRMLGKKKEQRYQTPAELLEDLNSPTLQRSNNTPNLLAMFDEDDFGDDSDEMSITSETADQSSDSFSTGKIPKTLKRRGNARPGKQSTRKSRQADKKFSSQPTRAEIPVSSKRDPRSRLVRLEINQNNSQDTARNLPWGLILMGLILIGIAIGVISLVNLYQSAPEVMQNLSPYATGPVSDPKQPAKLEADQDENSTDSDSDAAP